MDPSRFGVTDDRRNSSRDNSQIVERTAQADEHKQPLVERQQTLRQDANLGVRRNLAFFPRAREHVLECASDRFHPSSDGTPGPLAQRWCLDRGVGQQTAGIRAGPLLIRGDKERRQSRERSDRVR